MKRTEVVKKLSENVSRVEQFKGLLADTNDYYFDGAHITVSLETKQFSDKRMYHEGSLKVDNKLFRQYLENEIDNTEKEITELVLKLHKINNTGSAF
jgi:uncharacterized protein YcbK (DUF882 family)